MNRSAEGVLHSPNPQAWVTTFNESSIDFDVRFWHAPDIATQFRARSDVAMAIEAACDTEGIDIPLPQRVVTLDHAAAGRGSGSRPRLDAG